MPRQALANNIPARHLIDCDNQPDEVEWWLGSDILPDVMDVGSSSLPRRFAVGLVFA